jgi:ABC-2 type transport system permease protein
MIKREYLSFFRIRFSNGLQYRIAAYAGISTQFAWGAMNILMFRAFYRADPSAFPMEFSQFSSYIWLQQALLAIFMLWYWDRDIFDAITSGNIAYELVRPVDIYDIWFIRNAAVRLSRMILRCLPILLVAAFLPSPYGISLPDNIFVFGLFVLAAFLGMLVTVAYSMLFYIMSFYVINSTGVRLLAAALVEFLAGGIIPLPFFFV